MRKPKKSWNVLLRMLDLTGKVVAITGASRGIGWAVAQTFAQAGATLVLNARTQSDLLTARADELTQRFGVEVLISSGDVGDPATAQNLAKDVFSKFRQLDVLVNNAGILRDGLIGMITEEQVRETLAVNLEGVIYFTQAAGRLMKRNKSGSIINLTSIIGTNGNVGQVVYGASKAGVIGATLSAAKELASDGIRVNAIAPGYIETDMIRDIPPQTHQVRVDSIAMKRVGKPQDIANTALFLASDLSTYVTGQVIGVDGGMLI